MRRLLGAVLLLAVAAGAQTSVQLNPPWAVSLGGTDWTGVQCVGSGNQPGWMWGYVVKDAAGVPHVKLDYCDAATGTWLTIAWDNPAAGPQFADGETPAGAIDGKNATFTLAHAPVAGSVPIVSWNGVVQKLNGDYRLDRNGSVGSSSSTSPGGPNATITFLHAPAAGDSLQAWYRY